MSFSGHHKTLLASGGSEGDVRLWDVKRKRCLRVLRGHLSWVRSVEFCASTGILASGGDDRTVKVWDMDYEHHVERPSAQTFTGHSEYVMDVAFNPAGMGLLASCSFDGSCKLWNLSRFDLQSTAYHVPTKEEEEAKKEEEESKETDTARMSRELEVKRAQHQKLLKREANETYTGSGGEKAQLKMMEYEGIRRGAKQGNAEDLYAYGLWHDKGIVPELQGRPLRGQPSSSTTGPRAPGRTRPCSSWGSCTRRAAPWPRSIARPSSTTSRRRVWGTRTPCTTWSAT